ncbi:MAG: hypothetical protein ACK55Z_22650, partial [bacterium]
LANCCCDHWKSSYGICTMQLSAFNISADLKKIFKGPRPFKKEKTYLSGLTTPQGALLDHVASGAEY